MPGIINHGPALEIIDLIANKKINKKKKLKKFFLTGKVSKAIEKRLKINVSSTINGGELLMIIPDEVIASPTANISSCNA